jgi:hypothetical protein
MCSVSFLPNSRGFYLGMNRDESLQRPAANPPERFTRVGRVALYPTEPTGGSWVGVNDAGLTLALINWYAAPRSGVRPAADPKNGGGAARLFGGRRDARPALSRGIVVPSLLAATSVEEVRAAIAALPRQDMAPFRLLTFAPRERRVFEFRWDQHTLDEMPHAWEPRHWFSSGHDEPRAQHERGQVAREAWREARAGSLPWLRRLHGSHEPVRGPFCFCMHRKDAATVSYTEVVVTNRAATMRYHDGSLCTAPHPKTTHKISLQAACKESPLIATNQQLGDHHENHEPSLQSSRRPLLPSGLSPRRDLLEITH